MSFLPALISLCRPSSGGAEVGLVWAAPLDVLVRRLRWPLLALFGGFAAVGIVLLPQLPFDANPLHTKDANTEAMRTLEALRESPLANPFTADIMARMLVGEVLKRISVFFLRALRSTVWL